MFETAILFLTEHAVVSSTLASILAIAGVIWAVAKAPFKRDKSVILAPETIEQIAPKQAKDGPALTITEFIRIRRELKAEIEAELATAPDVEKDQLRARIIELERQIADPGPALAEARERIAELEARLDRLGNEIGGERLSEARVALAKGDYSVADDLFTEIEARAEIEVQNAARAAFGRGEIAEAEVRWSDAAEHYAKAARLDPKYVTLITASRLLCQAGRYAEAVAIGEELVSIAQRDHGLRHEMTAAALNSLAGAYKGLGRYYEAEPLFQRALKTTREVLTSRHPHTAASLNNLAGLLNAMARFEEAEPLFREALEIRRDVFGALHAVTASSLNNLAELLRETERFDEAEPLYREAQEIQREALGRRHPDSVTTFSNLALLLLVKRQFAEAEQLFREALMINREVLGARHPDTATNMNNLAALLRETGRFQEAEPLNREALEIRREFLGAQHPDTATSMNNLAQLLGETGRFTEAESLFAEGLEVLEEVLGPDHRNTQLAQQNIEDLRAVRDAGVAG